MTSRRPLAIVLGLCLAGASACKPGPERSAPSRVPAARPAARTNVVVLLSDDGTWQAISAYRRGIPVETPNLDRLARSGVRFDRSTVANSICSPSRATLLTGTHSHVNGVVDNYTPFDGAQTTYPKLLQRAGYQTAMIGKWHLHTLPTGYEHYDILDGQGSYYDPTFIRSGTDAPYVEAGHTDEIIGRKGVEWLREGRDPSRPFLLNLHFKVPHGPFMPPAAELRKIEGVRFPEPATLFDDLRGRSRATRSANVRLAEQYTEADLKVKPNPEPSGADRLPWEAFQERVRAEYAGVPRSGPERTRWVYQRYMQDYLRCMLALDRQVGLVLDTLEELGLAETTAVLFAGDQGFYLGEHGWYDKRWMYEPSFRTARMQGRSLVPLLRGERPADWRTSLYYHYYEGPEGDHEVARHEGVATDRYKLIHYYELGDWELYDLVTDPDEVQNRIADPSLAPELARLRAELDRLRRAYQVPSNQSIPRTQRRPIRTIGARYPDP